VVVLNSGERASASCDGVPDAMPELSTAGGTQSAAVRIRVSERRIASHPMVKPPRSYRGTHAAEVQRLISATMVCRLGAASARSTAG
jgi:hypothetical protein